jgi:dolichyl-phosphate-mannose-protein mannosyltransferase
VKLLLRTLVSLVVIAFAIIVALQGTAEAPESPDESGVVATIAIGTSDHNLLSNGDFRHGSGESPDEWRTGAWKESPDVTSYDWLHSDRGEPELVVNSSQPNDARWLQSLSLAAGWYYVSAEARAENVGSGATGVNVSLDEDGINSQDLRGTTGWQRLGFYLEVGRHGADVDVALRLGGFSSLNRGRAFFRDARVERIAAPPPGAASVFDLSAVRRSQASPPVGRPWTLPLAFAFLAIFVAAGWVLYGAADPLPSPLPPRAERRRVSSGARRGRR